MDFDEVVRRRRMVRRYDTNRPVPGDVLANLIDTGLHAPSAGFSQGTELLILDDAAARHTYWTVTADGIDRPDPWLRSMMGAPALIVCLSDPQAYLQRYTEPDKGWTDRDPRRWPVPYWDVDTGMAAMAMLLAAVNSGLGACFFGVPADRHDAVREAFAVPARLRLVGVISVGYPPAGGSTGPTGSARRPRRDRSEVVHRGRYGGVAPT